MKKLVALSLSVLMIFGVSSTAFAGQVAVRSLSQAEENYLSGVDWDYGSEVVRVLSEDIGTRKVNSYRMRAAHDYIMDEFKSMGYEPTKYWGPATSSPTGTANYENTGWLEIDGKDYLYYGPTYATSTAFKFGGTPDNNFEAAPATKSVTGFEIIDWNGTWNEEYSAATYQDLVLPEGANYSGKTVVVRNTAAPNRPISIPGGRSSNTNAPTQTGTQFYNAALALQNAGAAAVIFQYPEPAASYKHVDGAIIPAGDTVYQRIGNTTSGTEITIPVGTTLYWETNDLFSGMTAEQRAAANIKITMETNNKLANVYAVKKASVPTEKTIYLTAHMDSVLTAIGANDNASGVGMIMAIAKGLAKVDTTVNVCFLIVDGEESGLWGSNQFVQLMTPHQKENFVACYNMDMVAVEQTNINRLFINMPGTSVDPGATETVAAIWSRLAANESLWDRPEAIKSIADNNGSIYHNFAYAVDRTGNFPFVPKFDENGKITNNSERPYGITIASGSDHVYFYRQATATTYRNMLNSWHFDWRSIPKGGPNPQGFETLYHKVGDAMANFDPVKFEALGEIVALGIGYDSGLFPVKTYDPNFIFTLSSDKELVEAGTYFNLMPEFKNPVSSNVAVLNFKFDKNVFEYRNYEGLNLVSSEVTNDGVKLTVANLDDYNMTKLGKALFSAKSDASGDSTIELVVEYVYKDEAGNKTVHTIGAGYEFTTTVVPGDGYTLIELSNLIDMYGVKAGDAAWAQAKAWDFNGNKTIDVSDISYVAQRVK